jgi:uncharacterized protein YjcR
LYAFRKAALLLCTIVVNMAEKKSKKCIGAEQMFVQQLMDGKTIAETLDMPESTISRWRKKYNWDKLQQDTINNPQLLKRIISTEMLKKARGEKTDIDTDGLSKLFKIYDGLSDKINPGIVAAIMKEYDNFLSEINPDLAVANLPYNKKFLISIIERSE